MRRYKTNFINEMLRDLNRTSKLLKEDYMFDDEEMPMDDDMMRDPRMGRNPAVENDPTMQHHQQQPQQDSQEEVAMHAQEVIKHEPIIGKIRETAIEGLKKYADNPTSKLYEFFKKVFLESDKVLTDTGNK